MSEEHTLVIAPFLWACMANGLKSHPVYDKAVLILKSDKLTLYDKALLYQVIREIPDISFDIDFMLDCRSGCEKYEEEIFKEKKLNHVMTTGRDPADIIRQAFQAIDPSENVTPYKVIDGYVVSVDIEGK
jgi:hypothetical protein